MNLNCGKGLRSDIREAFLTGRIMRHWGNLSGDLRRLPIRSVLTPLRIKDSDQEPARQVNQTTS